MLHGIQGLLDEQYIDLSTPRSTQNWISNSSREHHPLFWDPAVLNFPEIHEDKTIYERIFDILETVWTLMHLSILAETIPWTRSRNFLTMRS